MLRELRAQLRAPPPDAAGYLRSQLGALRTAGARHQALEVILGCRRLAAADMEAAVDAVLDAYAAQGRPVRGAGREGEGRYQKCVV